MRDTYLLLGAGAGIGYSTARRFAAEGFRIVLAARNGDALDDLAQTLRREASIEVVTEVLDVTSPEAIASCIRRHAERIQILHYNAASIHAENFLSETAAGIAQDIAVSFSGGLIAIQEAARWMSPVGAGTILVTGGGLAVTPSQAYLVLGACKAALRNAVEGLFPTLMRHGVHIATLTIHSHIVPGSPEAKAVGEAFWNLHNTIPDQWDWEAVYPWQA